MPLHLLSEERFLAHQPSTNEEGNDSFIVMAKLDIPGEQAHCYLKFYQPMCRKAIINECAGHLIAESLGFSVPKNAGLLVIPSSRINNRPSWMIEEDVVGWFTQDTAHPSIKRSIHWVERAPPNRQKKYFARAKELLMKSPRITQRVIALDELIANSDRNPGNILIKDGGMDLIDHGRIFGDYNWKSGTLPAHHDMEVVNKTLALVGDEREKLPFKQGVILAYTQLTALLPEAIEELKKELGKVFEEKDVEAISAFLIARSTWMNMPDKMGLLI